MILGDDIGSLYVKKKVQDGRALGGRGCWELEAGFQNVVLLGFNVKSTEPVDS